MSRWWEKTLAASSLLRNSLALISGTVASQVILFLCSPLLSRVFTQADFGDLANYNAWISILALLSSLRYEHAVFVSRDRRHRNQVVALTAALTMASVLGYEALALALYFFYSGGGYLADLRRIVLYIPLGVLSVCIASLLIQINSRTGKFRRLAAMAAIQAAVTVLSQIALGLLRVPHAMIVGTVMGFGIAGAVFARWFFQRHRVLHVVQEMSPAQLRLTARQHLNFPRYTLAADAVGVVVQQFIPVFVLALFDPAIAGLYAFSTRIVRVPSLVVSTAVTGALRKEAADQVHAGRSLTPLLIGTVKTLCAIGILPFIVLVAFGRPLFAFVFGGQWIEAGTVAQILSPGILIEFVALPLSAFFLITHSQRYTLRIQLTGFALMVAALAAGRYYWNSFLATCVLVSATMVAVNLWTIVAAFGVSSRGLASATSPPPPPRVAL